MYCKAARFGDLDTQALILATPYPKQQKALGRQVARFSDARWDEVKSEVVLAGNIAKFGQNEPLGQKLLNTKDRLLVEASAKDRVWGIGFNEQHAMSHRAEWGQNLLGEALMAARTHLREQGDSKK